MSASKDDLVYVGLIVDSAQEAVDLAASRTKAAYDEDRVLRLALAQLVQRIGEAARRLSPEFRERHSGIPWEAVIGMRNRIVHDYMNVDDEILWATVRSDLPSLLKVLRLLLDDY